MVGRRTVVVAVLAVVFTAVAFCAVTLLVRHYQELRGEGAVDSPLVPAAAHGGERARAGRFTSNITYTSIATPGNGEVSSEVAWDDGWFFADPTVYNHELATTSSVLAALAYSESGYYQASNILPAYMERALATLGFDDVSTDSYRYRSEVVDEVLNLFTDDSDTVAYTIARKHLDAAKGDAPRDLILVSVRGSYGSEWLSNLNLMPASSDETSVEARVSQLPAAQARNGLHIATLPFSHTAENWWSSLAGQFGAASSQSRGDEGLGLQLDGTMDHRGYFKASEEICTELSAWISSSRAEGAEVSVLLVGHSRGGAIANLVASKLDDAQAEGEAALSGVASVYAYTFASPATTMSADAQASCYANIFNVVNPADIMPYLPLRAWGYERYGVNLYLPSVDEEGFEERHAAMCRAYAQTVGASCDYDPRDKRAIDAVVDEVSGQVATAQDLMTPAGIAATAVSCATKIDPVRILYGHYPSTYIAWMDVLESDELSRE